MEEPNQISQVMEFLVLVGPFVVLFVTILFLSSLKDFDEINKFRREQEQKKKLKDLNWKK